MMKPLHELGVAEALDLLGRGAITSEALVQACLDRIAAEEPRVQAWEFLDPQQALAQARRIDAAAPRPPLAGLPVGVKDIVDTGDMPTGCGSPIRQGRRPAADAACVAALRAAGAVILGKTVTTEFAFYRPGKTRNPHDPGYTPGGSSSGSAAAVAARMVPAALGTQTAGSIIRPAAFCGVLGWKPSHGLLSLEGVQPFAPALDTLGLLVRHLDDVPPLLGALGGPLEPPPVRGPLRVGLCRTEQWAMAAPESKRIVEEAARVLARSGASVCEEELGPGFDGLPEVQKTVMAFEGARSLAAERREHEAMLSPVLLDLIRQGEAIAPRVYQAAMASAERCRGLVPALFARVDVLLTPSACGEAPAGLESTGDPAFNRIWTLLHLPCVSLPWGSGPHGLPLGIQLVGPPRGDGRLLAAGRWIAERLPAGPTGVGSHDSAYP